MANLIVITFDKIDEAANCREAIRDLELPGLVDLDDVAIVTKDADGKIEYHGQVSGATKVGVAAGGMLGLLTALVFPVAGVAMVGAGALIGHSRNQHLDKKFVKQVEESLKPNSSALFLLGKGDPKSVLMVLEKFHGTVYSTTLAPELEEQLRDALK